MQSRCCWPPERPIAFALRRSFTSSQSAAWVSAFSTPSLRPSFIPSTLRPHATLSKIDFGNGFGRWKTIPIVRRTATASTSRAEMS